MKKNEIAVKLTKKNIHKVYRILNMFGERVIGCGKDVNLSHSENGLVFHYSEVFGMWISVDRKDYRKQIVKPYQLLEILENERRKKVPAPNCVTFNNAIFHQDVDQIFGNSGVVETFPTDKSTISITLDFIKEDFEALSHTDQITQIYDALKMSYIKMK